MDPTTAAIEVTAVHWEAWVSAVLRSEHGRALAATARPRRRRRAAPSPARPARGSLLWMLAVSAAGFWLLR